MNKSSILWLRGAATTLVLLLLQACAGEDIPVASAQQHKAPPTKTQAPPPTEAVVYIPYPGDVWGEQPMPGLLLGGMPTGTDVKHNSVGDPSAPLMSAQEAPSRSSLTDIGGTKRRVSSTTQKDEKIGQGEVQRSLHRKGSLVAPFEQLNSGAIDSIHTLVRKLSDPKTQDQPALIRILKACNQYFNKSDMTDLDQEEIFEYSELAKIKVPILGKKATDGQREAVEKLKGQLAIYIDVWQKRVQEDFRRKNFTQGVVQFLKHIDPQAFGKDTSLLIKLGRALLDTLPNDKSLYTRDKYPSHKNTLDAIEQALVKIRDISQDKLDPNGILYKSFKTKLGMIMEAEPGYYPAQYQAQCIAQNIARMQEAPSKWEQASDVAVRTYTGFKGFLQLSQGILGVIYFDLDLEEIETGIANIIDALLDTTEAGEGAHESFSKAFRATIKYSPAPWYQHKEALLLQATRCLLPEERFDQLSEAARKGLSSYAAYQAQQFAAYKNKLEEALKAVRDKNERIALQYSLVQQVSLLALQSQAAVVRKPCIEWLTTWVNEEDWQKEPGVFEAVLTALEMVAQRAKERKVPITTAQPTQIDDAIQHSKDTLEALAKRSAEDWPQETVSSCAGVCPCLAGEASPLHAAYKAWKVQPRALGQQPKSTGRLYSKVKALIEGDGEVKAYRARLAGAKQESLDLDGGMQHRQETSESQTKLQKAAQELLKKMLKPHATKADLKQLRSGLEQATQKWMLQNVTALLGGKLKNNHTAVLEAMTKETNRALGLMKADLMDFAKDLTASQLLTPVEIQRGVKTICDTFNQVIEDARDKISTRLAHLEAQGELTAEHLQTVTSGLARMEETAQATQEMVEDGRTDIKELKRQAKKLLEEQGKSHQEIETALEKLDALDSQQQEILRMLRGLSSGQRILGQVQASQSDMMLMQIHQNLNREVANGLIQGQASSLVLRSFSSSLDQQIADYYESILKTVRAENKRCLDALKPVEQYKTSELYEEASEACEESAENCAQQLQKLYPLSAMIPQRRPKNFEKAWSDIKKTATKIRKAVNSLSSEHRTEALQEALSSMDKAEAEIEATLKQVGGAAPPEDAKQLLAITDKKSN